MTKMKERDKRMRQACHQNGWAMLFPATDYRAILFPPLILMTARPSDMMRSLVMEHHFYKGMYGHVSSKGMEKLREG